MKIYKEGDKVQSYCDDCGIVDATCVRRDTPLKHSKDIVKNLLVEVCDKCQKTISIPHQSSIQIKEHLEIKRRTIKPFEARIPAHLYDVINLACYNINPKKSVSTMVPSVFRYYVHHLANDRRRQPKLIKYQETSLFKGKSSERFSVRFNKDSLEECKHIMDNTSLSKTDLIKSIILMIHDDINNEGYQKNIDFLKSASHMGL